MKQFALVLLIGTTLFIWMEATSAIEDKVEEVPPPTISEQELRQEMFYIRKLQRQEAIEKAKKEKEKEKEAEQIQEDEPATSSPIISLSNNEKDLLSRLVEAEAKGEPYEGKVGVAVVVLNRVLDESFPNDVQSVIYEKSQFTPVANGSINNKPSEESRQAVNEAIERINAGNTKGSLYFYNPKLCSSPWHESRPTVATIGNHVFKK